MMKTPFVWLGSKRAEKRGVAPIGARLDYAAKMGLPVADGAILLHEFYELLLEAELIHWQNGLFHANNPLEIHDALYTAVRFPTIAKPVVLHPSFTSQQDVEISLMQLTNAEQLTSGLCTIWQAAGPPTNDIRRDILIQEKLNFEVHGIVTSNPDKQFDQLCYDTQKIDITKLGRWESADKSLPKFAQRLQQLMRGIRRTFRDEAWEVAWGDNGRICYLTKIDAM